MKVELWGGENLLEPNRFASVVKALGQPYGNLAEVEKKVKSKRPGFGQTLTGAESSIRLTRDGRLEGTLAPAEAFIRVDVVCGLGTLIELHFHEAPPRPGMGRGCTGPSGHRRSGRRRTSGRRRKTSSATFRHRSRRWRARPSAGFRRWSRSTALRRRSRAPRSTAARHARRRR